MRKSKNDYEKKIEEWLDSDDEFPDTYNETPEVPAYLNDNRFESIKFGWIYNKNFRLTKNSNVTNELNNINTDECMLSNKLSNLELRKGLLHKHDIYCLKCVEKNIADNMLLRFVNFLMYKDMQSNYKFLRSCLVNECVYDGFKINDNTLKHRPDLNDDQKCYYRIIVKY